MITTTIMATPTTHIMMIGMMIILNPGGVSDIDWQAFEIETNRE